MLSRGGEGVSTAPLLKENQRAYGSIPSSKSHGLHSSYFWSGPLPRVYHVVISGDGLARCSGASLHEASSTGTDSRTIGPLSLTSPIATDKALRVGLERLLYM